MSEITVNIPLEEYERMVNEIEELKKRLMDSTKVELSAYDEVDEQTRDGLAEVLKTTLEKVEGGNKLFDVEASYTFSHEQEGWGLKQKMVSLDLHVKYLLK